ncbi:MAG: hypothetical protein ACM3ML_27750 [Micromonosporaceae bacterium]
MEPTEPIDRTEPAEPIDKIEPAEPIDKIEPLDPILRIEPVEPAERSESFRVGMVAFSQPWRHSGSHGQPGCQARSPDFTMQEARFLASLNGHLAAGLRKALLIGPAAQDPGEDPGPGIAEVTDQLELIKLNQAAQHWLADVGGTDPAVPGGMPHAVHAVVAGARSRRPQPPRTRQPYLRRGIAPRIGQPLDSHGRLR